MSSQGYLSDISKRLEEGWVLLNQHCPIPSCGTPLLRNPKGQIYCAKCEMYCITPEEAQCLVPSNDNVGITPEDSGRRKTEVESPPVTSSRTTREDSRAAAEARMGEKLLLGWTMLAEACPTAGCYFPLMLDRDQNTVCVACEGQNVIAAPTSSVPAPVSATTTLGKDDMEADEQALMAPDEFAAAVKKRDGLSAALGRYMLQGWSLLDKTCPREECSPGTPLLKDRTSGTLYCAACDSRMSEDEGGPLVMESKVGSPPALPVKRDSAGGSRNLGARLETTSVSKAESMQVESEYELAERARLRKQAARDRNDSRLTASAGLAEHLLQGWAMLSKACPRPGCHSPLMRDKNGTEVCIACSEPDPESDDGQSRVQTAGDVMGEKVTEEETEEDRDMVDGEAGREYANLRMAELTNNRAMGNTVSASATGGQDDVYYGCVKRRTLDTLYRAIDVSQQRLSVCAERPPVDVDESGRQADLIAKLAFAARAVCDLPTGERRE